MGRRYAHPVAVRDDRVRASVAGSMAGKAAELVTLGLLATVVPRVLGPKDYGRFSVPLTIVTLGSLAMSLGGPTIMARFVPTVPLGERPALARALGARLARGRAVQLVGVAGLAAVASFAAPSALPPLVTSLVVAALAVSVAASLLLQVLLGLGRTGPWATRYPLQNAVLIVGVLALHERWEGTGAVVAILVSALVALAFALLVTGPVLTAPPPAVAVPLPEGALRFGAFHAGGAALGQVADRAGVVVVALLGGALAETGFAALAIGVAIGVASAVLQTLTVSLPHVAGPGEASTAQAEAALGRLSAGLLAGLLPMALLAAVLLDDLIPVVFGDGFEGAVDAFVPVLGFIVLAPLSSLVLQVAALRVRPRASLANGVAGVVVFAAVAIVAVPAWQAAGATLAALAGSAARTGTSLRLLPGAADPRLVAASFGGAALVVLLAVVA